MISNDIVINTLSLMMLFFLFAWGGGVIYIYKVLGGPKVGMDSFLYFNFIFF